MLLPMPDAPPVTTAVWPARIGLGRVSCMLEAPFRFCAAGLRQRDAAKRAPAPAAVPEPPTKRITHPVALHPRVWRKAPWTSLRRLFDANGARTDAGGARAGPRFRAGPQLFICGSL
ncbi:hypothetical protein CE91St32_17810 [Gordonibacter pamelaeae]|nr:hypothetical protein CE91St32_17810 [Gordonibacter pamelaeae]